MPKRYLIPFALILMIVLAACSGGQTPEASQAEAAASQPQTAEESHDDDMDNMEDEGHDDDMDDMEDEAHDDDMDDMDDEGHDSDMDDMDDEGHDDDMNDMDGMEGEGHDDDQMAEESHDEEMEGEGHDDDMDDDGEMAGDSMAAANLPAWQTIALANAVTGEPFTLGDFQGKTVFVEPMATWCGNCKKQQGHVSQARAQLGDDVLFVGLSLETNLPAGELASYAQGNGFDWTYAVMSVDLLAGLTDEFGRSISNAPSTPHFIIRPDGSFTELATGIHSADEIVAEIQAEQG